MCSYGHSDHANADIKQVYLVHHLHLNADQLTKTGEADRNAISLERIWSETDWTKYWTKYWTHFLRAEEK